MQTSSPVPAPAKINLFFEVLGKRDDGFHEIVSVALPVRLFDRLTLEATDDGKITFQCTGQSADVPADETNIVVKTLNKLRQRYGVRCGASVHLQKQIPSQAGLGGGSSDAAAAASAAVKAWQLNVTKIEMAALLAEIGSDCPLFLYDTASISTGRGETVQPLPTAAPLWFVIWKPAQGLSTAAVYKECMPLHDGHFRKPDALITALASGNADAVGRELFNRLEVPARKLWTGFDTAFDDVRRKLTEAGCIAVQLCGSGASFFGLCYNQRHAEETASKLSLGGQVFAVCSGGSTR